MLALETILATLRSIKPHLEAEYGIRSMAVFGSYARGEQTPQSDIDILVELGEKPLGLAFVDLAEELERELKHSVDLVSKGAVKPQYYETMKNDLLYA